MLRSLARARERCKVSKVMKKGFHKFIAIGTLKTNFTLSAAQAQRTLAFLTYTRKMYIISFNANLLAFFAAALLSCNNEVMEL